MAAYNVENRFDPTLAPAGAEDDAAFTPTGANHWDDARVATKVAYLSGVIKKMNRAKGPDVLGLCEIENRAVVEKLAQAMTQAGRAYGVVHADSPSKRGIDCAIVYDSAKLTLHLSAFYAAPLIATRDVVDAEFGIGTKRLTVFMNHWPSQQNPAADRESVAKRMRRRLEQILAGDALADVLVMGDLNDKPGAASVATHLKTSATAAGATGGTFFNTTAPLAALTGRGTYVYQNQWETIDHVIVSPACSTRPASNGGRTRRPRSSSPSRSSRRPGPAKSRGPTAPIRGRRTTRRVSPTTCRWAASLNTRYLRARIDARASTPRSRRRSRRPGRP